MRIVLRKATLQDCWSLGTKLREEDKAEIRASSGRTPTLALMSAWDNSGLPLTIYAEDDVESIRVGMWGVVPTPGEPMAGAIWMMALPELRLAKMSFLRVSVGYVDVLNDHYPVLYNTVDARNTLHLKWLRWTGFTFIQRHEHFGYEQRPFYEFVRVR